MIFKSPLALTTVNDETLKKIVNSYLPYKTGIEIECAWIDEDNPKYNMFTKSGISNVIREDHDRFEKRFQIPPGINGMICLYKITEWLKSNCGLNEESGIHYHIDMGDFYIKHGMIDSEKTEWVLKSLDSWNYKGSYNVRKVGSDKRSWVAQRKTLSSLEFRIGEMTFDYELLIKRIIHCQNIVRKIKRDKPTKKRDFNIIFNW